MPSETEPDSEISHPPSHQRGTDAGDLVLAALDFLRGVQETGGSPSGPPSLAWQEARLREWADRLGLLLNAEEITPFLDRGGQEHEILKQDERVLKVTRNGVFGLSPGIELALVSSAQDARRFHLWEASPVEYLERLHLQNLLVPGLNRLEGIIHQSNGDLAIVTSQPRFEIIPVSVPEIDAWFTALGFEKITDSAYYRREDNLGVFDAHDKNLVRAGDDLVPFDVIPCHPAGGFLAFIEATLTAGHTLRAVRTVTTHRQP
jgi:Serine/Threonine/Tyrosine Kinase found in polyvalent proteins